MIDLTTTRVMEIVRLQGDDLFLYSLPQPRTRPADEQEAVTAFALDGRSGKVYGAIWISCGTLGVAVQSNFLELEPEPDRVAYARSGLARIRSYRDMDPRTADKLKRLEAVGW